MKTEKAEFAARLRDALKDASIEVSASVLEKKFNARYEGPSVTAQAVSSWLNGKSMPKQDKIRALAAIVGMDPHVLQYGNTTTRRIKEGRAQWPDAINAQDRLAFEAFLALPTPQRKLVREMIQALADTVAARNPAKGG